MNYLKYLKKGMISRRSFLKGALASIPIPILESMFPISAMAQSVQGKVNVIWILKPNGNSPAAFTSTLANNTIQFNDNQFMAPAYSRLTPFKSKIVWFNNCRNHRGNGNDGHIMGMMSYISGIPVNSNINGPFEENRIIATADHLLAEEFGGKPLVIGPSYNDTLQYHNISFRNGRPASKQFNPSAIFDTLFGNFTPPSGGGGGSTQPDPALEQLRRMRKSVLDSTLEQVTTLNRKVSSTDRQRLDQFLTSVREAETALVPTASPAPAPGPATPACSVPGKTEIITDTFANSGGGLSTTWRKRLDTTSRLIDLALRCERHRAVSWFFEREAGNEIIMPDVAPRGHHAETHRAESANYPNNMIKWGNFYLERVAFLAELMAQPYLPDGRSLLDTSVIMYGSTNGDGEGHTPNRCPGIVIGGANGQIVGNKVITTETHYPSIHKRLLQYAGVSAVTVNQLGDGTVQPTTAF